MFSSKRNENLLLANPEGVEFGSLHKFLRRNKGGRTGQIKKFSKRHEASTSNQNFTCFECGKPGHIKMDCPNIKKSSFKGKNELKNGRRACIAWEDNDTSSASESESEEQAHLSFMASHHSDDEESQKSILASVGKQYVTLIDYCNGVIDYREKLFENFEFLKKSTIFLSPVTRVLPL
ncbi:hypothetical protein Lal_00024147 [Lupinus albus]|nr:hypothetical protein Lal_00024147 [Lupinus albus]